MPGVPVDVAGRDIAKPSRAFYSSSHNHGSWKWVTPRLVSFAIGSFSTSMIMGVRVGGGYVVVSSVFFHIPILGEMIQFDEHIFQMG